MPAGGYRIGIAGSEILSSASPLDAREVTWRLPDHAPLRLQVAALRSDHLLSFLWYSPELPEAIRIRFELEAVPAGTRLSISEAGWRENEFAAQQAATHRQIWQNLLLSLKTWLEDERNRPRPQDHGPRSQDFGLL